VSSISINTRRNASKAGVELVRRVDQQPLGKFEEAEQLAGLKQSALAVLPADDQTHLERGPLVQLRAPERVLEDELLPRVQMQPRRGRKLHRLHPK
jgi:hypothetical protein